MDTTQFPRRFDKYILLDRVNKGGMAEVFRAKLTGAESFQRLLAIKCMLPTLAQDREFVSMFVDEAKLAAQLSHANIVQIHELGKVDDQLYIAMELINGRDLRHIIKTAREAGKRVPLPFAAYVIAKAAEGLDFAHRKKGVDGTPLNLVHRDISPQNILLSYDGEVKVVDFGIAKAEERATQTQAGMLKGKFAFMSPEQVNGDPVDQRTDIFALGAVLFEAVTGERLFQGKSDIDLLKRVRAAELPPLDKVLAGAPEELKDCLRRALAREPQNRFTYASELAEALSPLLIDNRIIFGAKHASEFMESLYAAEIQELTRKLQEYAGITEADCIGGGTQDASDSGTEVVPAPPADDAFGATSVAQAPQENLQDTIEMPDNAAPPAPPQESHTAIFFSDGSGFDPAAGGGKASPAQAPAASQEANSSTVVYDQAPSGATDLMEDADDLVPAVTSELGEPYGEDDEDEEYEEYEEDEYEEDEEEEDEDEGSNLAVYLAAAAATLVLLTTVGILLWRTGSTSGSEATVVEALEVSPKAQDSGKAQPDGGSQAAGGGSPSGDGARQQPANPQQQPGMAQQQQPGMAQQQQPGAAQPQPGMANQQPSNQMPAGGQPSPSGTPSQNYAPGRGNDSAPGAPGAAPSPSARRGGGYGSGGRPANTNSARPGTGAAPSGGSPRQRQPAAQQAVGGQPRGNPAAAEQQQRQRVRGPGKQRRRPRMRQRRARHGFISVIANGLEGDGKIFVDGKHVGFSPLAFHKLKVGKHQIRIVEILNGEPGQSKSVTVQIKPSNTRSNPEKLVVAM